jgi:hypothetical protein
VDGGEVSAPEQVMATDHAGGGEVFPSIVARDQKVRTSGQIRTRLETGGRDRIGFFPVLSRSDREIVLGEDDRQFSASRPLPGRSGRRVRARGGWRRGKRARTGYGNGPSDVDPGADLDGPVDRDAEVAGRVRRRARHGDVEPVLPDRHACLGRGHQDLPGRVKVPSGTRGGAFSASRPLPGRSGRRVRARGGPGDRARRGRPPPRFPPVAASGHARRWTGRPHRHQRGPLP